MGVVLGALMGSAAVLLLFAMTTPPRHWSSHRTDKLRDLLIQAGVGGTSPLAFIVFSMGLAIVTALVFLGISQAWPVAAAFGAIASMVPWMVVSQRARSRRTHLRETWPDAIDDLLSSVRAGMSLPEALGNLGVRGPVEIRSQCAAFARDYQSTARFSESLDRLKERFADPVADRIIEALRLAHDVGGTDVGVLLTHLSRMLREDLRTRGELEARQSWTVNGAKVAVAAPWIILALLSSRQQAASAYATSTGAMVLLGGACACAVAYWLMIRIGRLREEQRVLR
ncbi:type II secretion system F family protein [Actinomyces vulturis]|uniref:type II secretion system F family protein n=1 Tax=Actinomyces vulturis TaxID=1857645 RepID=UPI0008363F09